ncbi:MAG: GDSL-type esterase/lipase family protein [Kofleriaceae bacterium]|nr:GDSL-type esterase/lipase family protein [Kofleriaceae bacterium]
MQATSAVALGAFGALALLGCSSGCDGERVPPKAPRLPIVTSSTDGGAGDAGSDVDAGVVMPSFLDAPAGSLDALFAALAASEKGDAPGRTLLLFFGDSHTAGDAMTSRIRTTLQAKFGDAGRGLVAAGRPKAKHYYQRDVRYGASGAWRAAVGGKSGDAEPFGIGGIRVFGERKGAQLWVETCADCAAGTRVSLFEVLYQAAPEHGVLRYRVDEGAWTSVSTRTQPIEPPHPARVVIPVPDGAHKLTLEHGGGGILDLYGVVLERVRPGVVVDSLGVVGRRLGSLRSWDWSIIGEQLSTRDPRLVVLQYGTNEADDPDLDLVALAKYFDEMIARIRASAPGASILIMGPPDMGVREGGRGCDRMKPNPDGGIVPECQYRTPQVLTDIIAVEHAAAARNKVAFFDTFAAMGGPDKMAGWVASEPKVAFKDHVHFTSVGYQQWADALLEALLGQYDRWRTSSPPSSPH